MNDIFDKTILSKQSGEEYDPDSSPLAWEHYRKVYTMEHWGFLSEFDVVNVDTYNKLFSANYNEVKYKRLLAGLKPNSLQTRDEKLGRKFTIGGETDFNFNSNKIQLFKKIIAEKLNDESRQLLKECKRSHHTLKNFSLMAATGSMNIQKGKNRFDRLDTFVYNLNNYFSGKTGAILDEAGLNRQPLKYFLSTFDSVYDYCNKIYFIKDNNFINRIIEEGRLPIQSTEDVVRYMILAKDFWAKKKSHYEYLFK